MYVKVKFDDCGKLYEYNVPYGLWKNGFFRTIPEYVVVENPYSYSDYNKYKIAKIVQIDWVHKGQRATKDIVDFIDDYQYEIDRKIQEEKEEKLDNIIDQCESLNVIELNAIEKYIEEVMSGR